MLKKKHSSLIISYVILIVLAYVMIYPLLWMVGASFKSNAEIFSTVGLLPKEPVFGAFKAGWEGTGRYGFSTYLINSFELVLPTVLFTVISGVLIGYGFARFDFPLKKFWFAIMLSTLMLPSTVIIIPRYIYFKQLGWLDSYMPFWIPALLGCTTFFNYMFIQFFRGLPLELDESAKLDGCNSFRILIQILLPLCTIAGTLAGSAAIAPILPTVGLTDALAIGSGLGYYSLSSIFINELRTAELGAVALLCNVLRELFTLLAAPYVARRFGPLAAISSGGATTFDTTLPVLTRSAGAQYAVVAIFHGCATDFSVPLLVTLFCTI